MAGLLACSLQARADVVIVGLLSFDNTVPAASGAPGNNGFTIQNFTGANSQPGTPDSSISFLDTSLLLNGSDGTQTVNIGSVDPGSVQPASLEFSTDSTFTDATLNAMLSTTLFSINGQDYIASSDVLMADLTPGTPPNLVAGTDLVTLQVNASLAEATPTPEPAAFWLMLCPVAYAIFRGARRRA